MRTYTDQSEFIMLPIPITLYTAVCALLGGVSTSAVAASSAAPKADAAKPDTAAPSGQSGNGAGGEPSSTSTTATSTASPSDDVDAGGHPWSEALHASTKTKTKDGYWRMKVGVSRPENLAGFPKDATTGTASTGTAASGGSSANGASAPGTAAAPAADEDDEFAAFRDALGNQAANGAAAAAAIPARKWTDADLGALCNQAAVKLGDPAPVKALIASYMPEGTVPHSRNIPEDKRAEFAAAVEAKADITFAG